jgi:anti-sigma-K factor RskA
MDFRSMNDHNDSHDDDGSETSDPPNNSLSVNNDYNKAKSNLRNVTKGYDQGVLLWRTVVKVTMIAIAIALTVVTYVQLKRSETNKYRSAVSDVYIYIRIHICI